MPSVILLAPDGHEFTVSTAEALVWAVYGRGAQPKNGTIQENLEVFQGANPPADAPGMRYVNSIELADPTSLAAQSVLEGLEQASNVSPAGSWNFLTPPMVNGVPISGGGGTALTQAQLDAIEAARTATTGTTPSTIAIRDAAGWLAAEGVYIDDQPVEPYSATRKDYVDTEVATRIPTFADPGADRLVGWDDSAGAWLPVSIGNGLNWNATNVISSNLASEAGVGAIELATSAEVATGTDAGRAVTPLRLKERLDTKAAVSHTHGVADLTATGTKDSTTYLRGDNTWAAPPAGGGGWAAVDASETVKGIVELATTAETTTGTDTVRAVTPAGVKAVADTKAATAHTHVAANISDSTTTGRSVLTAADAAAARTAIGAGTSSLVIGTTGTTAAAGNDARLSDARTPTAHTHTAANISDSTTVGRSLLTAADAAAARTAAGAAATSHTHGVADLTATGTKDSTTVLHGDNVFRVPAGGGGGWTAVDASETVKGIVELATTTETTTGTDTVRAVTPAGVKAVADTKAATSHTHTAANISDSTTTGRSVLTAADASAARTAIGAGTSNLAIGTTSTTAKAGDYVPPIDQAAGTASMRTLGTSATQAAAGNDARLSDARTPTAHTHTASQVSDSTTTGRSVLTAADAAAARTAISAGRVDSSDGSVLDVVKVTAAAHAALVSAGTTVATRLYVIVG